MTNSKIKGFYMNVDGVTVHVVSHGKTPSPETVAALKNLVKFAYKNIKKS